MMNLEQAINHGNEIGVKYYIKNSNGGLLGGTKDYKEAVKMKDEFQKQYDNDKWNKGMKVFIVEKINKRGK